jgi:hypothetical protein
VAETLEPREVDKPYARRWLTAALTLFLRSPVRFGLLIVFLATLDSAVVSYAQGYSIERKWLEGVGAIALPLVWVIVSAVARGADDGRQTWDALAQIRHRTVWLNALATGAILATINYAVAFSLQWLPGVLGNHEHVEYLRQPGQLLDSIDRSVLLMTFFVGLCYFPLLALVPQISRSQAMDLSRRATDINGRIMLMGARDHPGPRRRRCAERISCIRYRNRRVPDLHGRTELRRLSRHLREAREESAEGSDGAGGRGAPRACESNMNRFMGWAAACLNLP